MIFDERDMYAMMELRLYLFIHFVVLRIMLFFYKTHPYICSSKRRKKETISKNIKWIIEKTKAMRTAHKSESIIMLFK